MRALRLHLLPFGVRRPLPESWRPCQSVPQSTAAAGASAVATSRFVPAVGESVAVSPIRRPRQEVGGWRNKAGQQRKSKRSSVGKTVPSLDE